MSTPKVARVHEYEAGEFLFREGAPSRHVYRLVEGKGEILRRTPQGLERIGLFHPDEFVGEMGVLIATPRNATARFLTKSTVAQFSRAEFLKMVRRETGLDLKVLNALSLRTRAQIELLARSPGAAITRKPRWVETLNQFLRARWKALPFTQKTAALFPASKFTKASFAKDQVLFREGDLSEIVYWIVSGRVRVERKGAGGPHVGRIGKNEFLGEMGVLESAPRTATAVAETAVEAYAIPPSPFFELMKSSAPAYFTVLESLCERARRLNHQVRDAQAAAQAMSGGGDLFQTASSIDSMTQLAEARFQSEAERMRNFLLTQKERGAYVAGTYQKYLKGLATAEEMEKANVYLRDYFKMAGIGTLFLLPGGVITVPLAAKIGKAIGVDIFPSADPEKE